MNIKLISLLVPTLLVVGCGRITTPPKIIPPSPPKTESVIPHVKKVGEGIDQTIKENIKLSEKLKEQKKIVFDQKVSITDALAQAEKMKEKAIAKEIITELEATDLVSKLKNVQDRNMFLETSNTELTTIKTDQEKILQDLKNKNLETAIKLTEQESENKTLRGQNDYYKQSLSEKNNEAETLKSDLAKEKVKSSRNAVYRNWIIGLVVGWLLWTVAKNVLMVYFPATRFRI